MTIAIGDALPAASMKQRTADGIADVDLAKLTAGKKVILFGLPGAYTPVCTAKHLPGYVAAADELKAEGVDAIACISVNDPFVLAAWGEQQGAADKVMMLSDPKADFIKTIGMDLDLTDFGLGERSKRWSMVVEDGKVTALNVEESIFDHGASSASHLLAKVPA